MKCFLSDLIVSGFVPPLTPRAEGVGKTQTAELPRMLHLARKWTWVGLSLSCLQMKRYRASPPYKPGMPYGLCLRHPRIIDDVTVEHWRPEHGRWCRPWGRFSGAEERGRHRLRIGRHKCCVKNRKEEAEEVEVQMKVEVEEEEMVGMVAEQCSVGDGGRVGAAVKGAEAVYGSAGGCRADHCATISRGFHREQKNDIGVVVWLTARLESHHTYLFSSL